ncbi:putative methyltransferase [Hamiltosporidium tvaerminnensis]|uniref:Putative methyltransferase n=1 Tax=Hamiltosporidium tvaerminnensis TaxID=1176355 RepID=A0A4V2JVU5_9MICR|nr:Williams Beuren syndrome chromosome region 22 protein [Hamiltosporidium tvaerminnensis]TBU05442.1 putative methyltransferase [Hamiltosporidium tvaerminnensis]
MTERCIELCEISKDHLILDLGCGSGISGCVLSQYEYIWIGTDISHSMLKICKNKEFAFDLCRSDIGTNFCFKKNTFDKIISVSVLQWLFHSYSSTHEPFLRINIFFKNLFFVLKNHGQAVLQFYPENSKQTDIFIKVARKVGFQGGLVIDNEGTKNKKYFLVLRVFKQ